MALTPNRIEGGFATATVGTSDIAQYILAKVQTDGTIAASGASTDVPVYITEISGSAGASIPVRLVNSQGFQYGVASGAVASAGLALYTADGGKVSTTQASGATFKGISLAAAADGGVVAYTKN